MKKEEKSPVFVLGQLAFYIPESSTQEQTEATTIVGKIKVEGCYLIEHLQGDPLEKVMADQSPSEVELVSGQSLNSKYKWAGASELAPMEVGSEAFEKLNYYLRMQEAVRTKDEAYLGKLVLRGELAPVSMQAYSSVVDERNAILRVLQVLNAVVAPLFDSEGKPQLMAMVNALKGLQGANKMMLVMRLMKLMMTQKDRIAFLYSKLRLDYFKALNPMELLAICNRHGLILSEFVFFLQEAGLIKSAVLLGGPKEEE